MLLPGPFEEMLRQASLTVFTAASLLRGLKTNPWINSVEVTAVVPAGITSVPVLHGLGRAFNGAVVVGASRAALPLVLLPDSAAETHLTVVLFSALGTDLTLKLRVY